MARENIPHHSMLFLFAALSDVRGDGCRINTIQKGITVIDSSQRSTHYHTDTHTTQLSSDISYRKVTTCNLTMDVEYPHRIKTNSTQTVVADKSELENEIGTHVNAPTTISEIKGSPNQQGQECMNLGSPSSQKKPLHVWTNFPGTNQNSKSTQHFMFFYILCTWSNPQHIQTPRKHTPHVIVDLDIVVVVVLPTASSQTTVSGTLWRTQTTTKNQLLSNLKIKTYTTIRYYNSSSISMRNTQSKTPFT